MKEEAGWREGMCVGVGVVGVGVGGGALANPVADSFLQFSLHLLCSTRPNLFLPAGAPMV